MINFISFHSNIIRSGAPTDYDAVFGNTGNLRSPRSGRRLNILLGRKAYRRRSGFISCRVKSNQLQIIRMVGLKSIQSDLACAASHAGKACSLMVQLISCHFPIVHRSLPRHKGAGFCNILCLYLRWHGGRFNILYLLIQISNNGSCIYTGSVGIILSRSPQTYPVSFLYRKLCFWEVSLHVHLTHFTGLYQILVQIQAKLHAPRGIILS